MIGVIAWGPGLTTGRLVTEWRLRGLNAAVVSPLDAPELLTRGDVALVRLDVVPTLDACEPGLEVCAPLADRGVRVLNGPHGLLAAHDKLRTAHALERAGLPHPATRHVTDPREAAGLEPPLVLKPPFGSWGHDVLLCRTPAELAAAVAVLPERRWFRTTGVLAQEVVPDVTRDLRVLVADARTVGASARVSAPGEWRTNTSLGGRLESVDPPDDALRLAVAATGALGIDLAGVDLLPAPDGGWIVLEVNGAADFDERYALPGRDVYDDVAAALRLDGVTAEL
ncbi:MAG: ATP-grasp domain-containing protein [Gaiellaceae bacterium]